MTLRRAEDIELETRGAWFFRSIVITTSNATFSLRGRRLREVEEQRVGGAALVGESRGRRLWWVGDGFYWDADGLDAEHATPTEHPKVLRARNAALPVGLTTVVADLLQAAQEGWPEGELRTLLKRLVPDYEPSLAGIPVRHPSRSRDSGGRPRVEE